MFQTVFMDLDNTLIDFDKGAEVAMREQFAAYGLPYSPRRFEIFTEINGDLWKQIERGELTREELRLVRWNRIFGVMGIEADGVAFEAGFAEKIENLAIPVEGAAALLDYLRPKYRLCAVTNGFARAQLRRLHMAGFDDYFDRVFISEQLGSKKPEKAFFDAVFDQLGSPPRDSVVLIGDSLTADIGGGEAYGLTTIWLNRTGEAAPIEIRPTYTVTKLEEIRKLL